MQLGTPFNKQFTFGASGRLLIEFTSPRTGKGTFARKVQIKPYTTALTVSVDGGTNSVTVPVLTAEPRFEMDGVISRLLLVGTNGSNVDISAMLAS